MRNIRLLIAYDGTDFHGWQRQPNALTVQECLESAIERILGEKAQVWGSGRTDAGVHALNQVANFKTDCPIPCENLVKALNDALPPTVRIKDAHEVSAKFHARYDVRSKTYRYRILQAPVCSPFLWRFVWHYPFPLDGERMAEAAKLFEGEHDFTSFAAVDGSAAEESCQGRCAEPNCASPGQWKRSPAGCAQNRNSNGAKNIRFPNSPPPPDIHADLRGFRQWVSSPHGPQHRWHAHGGRAREVGTQ